MLLFQFKFITVIEILRGLISMLALTGPTPQTAFPSLHSHAHRDGRFEVLVDP